MEPILEEEPAYYAMSLERRVAEARATRDQAARREVAHQQNTAAQSARETAHQQAMEARAAASAHEAASVRPTSAPVALAAPAGGGPAAGVGDGVGVGGHLVDARDGRRGGLSKAGLAAPWARGRTTTRQTPGRNLPRTSTLELSSLGTLYLW